MEGQCSIPVNEQYNTHTTYKTLRILKLKLKLNLLIAHNVAAATGRVQIQVIVRSWQVSVGVGRWRYTGSNPVSSTSSGGHLEVGKQTVDENKSSTAWSIRKITSISENNKLPGRPGINK